MRVQSVLVSDRCVPYGEKGGGGGGGEGDGGGFEGGGGGGSGGMTHATSPECVHPRPAAKQSQ